MKFLNLSIYTIIFILFTLTVNGQPVDQTIDLSKVSWKLWLDKDAAWENDELFLPPVDISKLPVNMPTGGWEKINNAQAKTVKIPATVEEYFWGENGSSFGITGNYVGVSWFSTEFDIPSSLNGKRLILDFESVRLRAEIFVNEQLVGYDLINGTPFEIDITKVAKIGDKNSLSVRITDPNGNFAWRDWETYRWGKYEIAPSHGFGGITGLVKLRATDNSFISDLFIKNKPQVNAIDAEISLMAKSDGVLNVSVSEKNGTIKNVGKIQVKKSAALQTVKFPYIQKDAKLWTPDSPNLYDFKVEWTGVDGSKHEFQRRFGFRWFDIQTVNGDRMFFLNGKRVFLLTAISWGHWPINGIYPTEELARKQIQTAKSFGMNMLNFHRGIGQTMVMNIADELGLMYYEEPGGYKPGQDEFSMAFKREKLLRMVQRDRNHPSMLIYSMINEAGRDPFENEKRDIADAHKLDETRCITFSSQFYTPKYHNSKAPLTPSEGKMFMEPYNHEIKFQGWFDEHHAGGPGVYDDKFYNGKTDFRLYIDHPSEILFWGEEGAIGTPPRLEHIKKSLESEDRLGWDGDTYQKMFDAFDSFIKKNNFTKAFPTVDSLTRKLGNVALYYHGRTIENCRIGNLTDGYAINGWESTKIENHSGIVDVYRNPKGDINVLSRYNQPLYVAVKLRTKVLEVGKTSISDFYIVNETNLKGSFNLKVLAKNNDGIFFDKVFPVKVIGGTTYGQLLAEGVSISIPKEGYSTVEATLLKGNTVIASGDDQIYAVNLDIKDLPSVAILDSSNKLQQLFEKVGGITVKSLKDANNLQDETILFVGDTMQNGMIPGNFRDIAPVMEWVWRGNTLVFIANADFWGEYLNTKELADYRGKMKLDGVWFGGNYFVKEHPIFAGLPQNTVFNWEYQSLAGYDMNRAGMRIASGDCVVGCYADHNHELYSALQVINCGKGKIILSSLDLSKAIRKNENASVVAKRIVKNIVEYSKLTQ